MMACDFIILCSPRDLAPIVALKVPFAFKSFVVVELLIPPMCPSISALKGLPRIFDPLIVTKIE
jgi:hypothetical protein